LKPVNEIYLKYSVGWVEARNPTFKPKAPT